MGNIKTRATLFASLLALVSSCASPSKTADETLKTIRDYVEKHNLTLTFERGGRYYGFDYAYYQQWHGKTYSNGQETLYAVSWFQEDGKRSSEDYTLYLYYYAGFYYAAQSKQVDVWIIPGFDSYRIKENQTTGIDVYIKSTKTRFFSAADPFDPDLNKWERYPAPSGIDQNTGYNHVSCQYDGTQSTESLIDLYGLDERWVSGTYAAYLRTLSIADSYVSSIWDYKIEDYTGMPITKHTFESRERDYSIDMCYTLFDA